MSAKDIDHVIARLDDPENGLVAIRTDQKWIRAGMEQQAKTITEIAGEGLARCKRHDADIAQLKSVVKMRSTDNPQIEENWLSFGKLKAHGWPAIFLAGLVWLTWLQYHNAGKADSIREDVKQSVIHEIRGMVKQ
jgi:hypothetical protein